MKIWAHTIVKNEERYLWFSVMSVVNYLDRILIWDTGSSDNTLEIIKDLKRRFPEKIYFKEVGEVDRNEFTKVRQQMLDQTTSDWFMVVDGDEVWWNDSIKNLTDFIKGSGNDFETIVSPHYDIVGDIFHYQEERGGRYKIDDKFGHFNIRAMNRKIPGIHLEKPHGTQGFYDSNGTLIQNRDSKKRKFLDYKYLHFTHMIRSSTLKSDNKVPIRNFKFKYELGVNFPLDFYYPEVFFLKRPDIVPSPWQKMKNNFKTRALIETPLKKIKRRLLP